MKRPAVRAGGRGGSPAVERVREALAGRRGVTERRMFGGVAFLLNGNMCCGVTRDGAVVLRIGAGRYDEALAHPDVRECDFTGRPMRGMVMLTSEALAAPLRLDAWVSRAAGYATSLPRKAASSESASRSPRSRGSADHGPAFSET